MAVVYKISPRALWREAEAAGVFSGSEVDHADGFIHFSTAAQVAETAARHFAGEDGPGSGRGRRRPARPCAPLRAVAERRPVSASLRAARSRRGALGQAAAGRTPTAAINSRTICHEPRLATRPAAPLRARSGDGAPPRDPRAGLRPRAVRCHRPTRRSGSGSSASIFPIRSAWPPASTRTPRCPTRCSRSASASSRSAR